MLARKAVLLVIVAFLISANTLAQVKVNGHINNSGIPVPNANVILYSNDQRQDIIAYAATDQNGDFELNLQKKIDTLFLEFNCLGFNKKAIKIQSAINQVINIELEKAAIALEEVSITENSPIIQKGDTLNFKARNFSDQSDRVILDIIKKIPGITVNPTGQILYQNKAINKFYIEGQDLLGDKYNIATNNLPSKDVDKVQVLENHQPIKILKGIAESDRAAINIKLVDSVKTKLLGGGNLGVGLSPFLRNNDLTLLEFEKKFQLITSIKNNNIGNNLDDELTEQNISQNFFESGSIKQDMLFLIKASPPPLDENRYWFNNNTLVNGNFLYGLSKNLNIKGNVALVNDLLDDQAVSVTKLYLPSDTVTIFENHKGHRTYNKLLATAALEANTEKHFINNTIRFQRIWDNSSDYISSNTVNQNLQAPFINLLNNFNGIFTINKTLLNIGSFTSFSNLPQTLSVTPGQFPATLYNNNNYDETIQKVNSKSLYSDNYASFTKNIRRFQAGYKLGFRFTDQELNNYIRVMLNGNLMRTANNFNNQTNRGTIKLYDEFDTRYTLNRLMITLLIMNGENELYSNELNKKLNTLKSIFDPSLNLKYTFAPTLDGFFNASQTTKMSYNSNQSFILQNYRTLGNSDVPLFTSISRSLSYRMTYKDVVSALFSNLDISYVSTVNNILLTSNYNGILNTTTAVEKDNPSQGLNVMAGVNKFYSELKTTIDLSINYDLSKYQVLQQNVLSDYHQNIWTLKAKINTNPTKLLAFEYNFTRIKYRSFNSPASLITSFPTVQELINNMTSKIFLTQNTLIRVNIENYNNLVDHKNTVENFADLIFQKTVTRHNLDISIALNNVFNTRTYSNYSYSTSYFVATKYTLRPRTLMFNCSYQF